MIYGESNVRYLFIFLKFLFQRQLQNFYLVQVMQSVCCVCCLCVCVIIVE